MKDLRLRRRPLRQRFEAIAGLYGFPIPQKKSQEHGEYKGFVMGFYMENDPQVRV
jgi:hypothetical protein